METDSASWTYFMALAWLCTRNQEVVDRIANLPADHMQTLTAMEAEDAVRKEWLRAEHRVQKTSKLSHEARFDILITELDSALIKGG